MIHGCKHRKKENNLREAQHAGQDSRENGVAAGCEKAHPP